MALERHEDAERQMALGDRALAEGRPSDAERHYSRAAEAEREAFRLIPKGRPRTRGVTAISTVSLFRQAGARFDAVIAAHEFLALRDLPDWARADLEELVEDLQAETRAAREERTLGHSWFEWRLTGGKVGTGVAPIDVIARKIGQIESAAVRVYEMLAGLTLRRQGQPTPAVRDRLQLLMSQPAAGSFRFRLRFSVPAGQTEMFAEETLRPVAPEAVSDRFFEVLEAVVEDDASRLASAVPEEEYREAFLRLVKAIVPDGQSIEAIEVVRGEGERRQTTVLRPGSSKRIEERLRALRPPAPQQQGRVTIVDTLRGLHLNKRWIVLGAGDNERKVYVGKAMVLEDLIEGLVDHLVKVTGHTRGGPWGTIQVVMEELVEAGPEEQRRYEATGNEEHNLSLWMADARRSVDDAIEHVAVIGSGDGGLRALPSGESTEVS